MAQDATATGARARRLAIRVAGLGLILLLALAFSEGLLRAAALFAPDRGGAWRDGARHRVLAVGDSHTWGAGVDRDASYPARLQERLDELEPGVHSVVNLGVPGMSTTQVRNRLGDWIERYRPDAVVVWCGVNDAWNHAEREAQTASGRLRALLARLRVVRLWQVWWRDREIEGYEDGSPAGEWQVVDVEREFQNDESWTLRMAGRTERIVHDRGERTGSDAEIQAQTESNLEALAEIARASGVEIFFITYPKDKGVFAVANRAIRSAGARRGVPVIESPPTLERVPPEARNFQWAGHPTPPVYREIARDVAAHFVGRERADEGAGAG